MTSRKNPIIFFLIILFVTPLSAADKYERKSISYVNALWLATQEARDVEPSQVDYMLETIKRHIEAPRFDYNPLPTELTREFVKSANANKKITVDELARLMGIHLAPKILGVLEGSMRDRAGELVSEAGRQGFLATKAKELGITLDEIEKVMNSAYIYLPVLTNFSMITRDEDDVKDKRYVCTIEGGIIWFSVETRGDSPTVKLLVSNTTVSKGVGSARFAYQSAVKNFARNLQTATQTIPEFKLGTHLTEFDGLTISFPLGTKEGLHVDDTYFVGEWIEGGDGKIGFQRTGWVRVSAVADNRASDVAESKARAVKGGDWAPGMTVVEHPRLGIDIALKPGIFQTSITKGRIPILLSSRGELQITEDYDTYAPGFDIEALYNLAPITGVSQLFFLVGGNLVFPATLEFDADIFTLLSSSPPFIWGIHGGIVRKVYLGRIALSAGAMGGGRFLTVEQKFRYQGTVYKYSVKNISVGAQFACNLEYAASPDVNVGITAGYRLFPPSELWTQDINPSDNVTFISWDEQFPDISHTGLAYGLYIHYSVPALPIDPIGFFQGTFLGE